MNDQEAAKLLSLVKLSYPAAYRDMDRQSAAATVKMWASSFAGVPYPVAERAFDRFRMKSKFPPTVACLAGELKKMYFEAENAAFAHSFSSWITISAQASYTVLKLGRTFARKTKSPSTSV